MNVVIKNGKIIIMFRFFFFYSCYIYKKKDVLMIYKKYLEI